MSFDEQDWWRPVGGSASHQGILERRSLIWNDNGVVDRALFPILGTDAIYKGKFFTRGCRGMIEEILIYRTATAGGTITLRMSPHPCLGPLYTVVIPAGPANAWTGVAFERMWNYDSLFIWVLELEAGEEWGYDAAMPYDCHVSEDIGDTWADLAIRPFIRAVYTGETPGDVPVSGILNVIPLPNLNPDRLTAEVEMVADTATFITGIAGAGFCELIYFDVTAAANSHLTEINVRCEEGETFSFTMEDLFNLGVGPLTESVALLNYGEDCRCTVMITHRFDFWRRFHVWAYNLPSVVTVRAYIHPTLLR